MRHAFLAWAGSLALTLGVHSAPVSASAPNSVHALAGTAMTTFRLRTLDRPSADTTFWVAYGPLNGRFGLVQLRPVGPHVYEARKQLPATGRTTFAYLSGHGAVRTRFGLAPGDPVETIRRIGPVALSNRRLPTVSWHTPIG